MAQKRKNFISKEEFESKITKRNVSWNELSGNILRLEDLKNNVALLSDEKGIKVHVNLPNSLLKQIPEMMNDSIIYLRPNENDADVVIVTKIYCVHCCKEFSSQRSLKNHGKKTCI